MKKHSHKKIIITIACSLLVASVFYFLAPKIYTLSYSAVSDLSKTSQEKKTKVADVQKIVPSELTSEDVKVTHVPPPESMKSVYMSSWVAGTPSFRNKIIKLIDETEINSVVIDIKDYTGKISFKTDDPILEKIGSSEKRIADIKQLIAELHGKGVYVIGRIAVFQDPYLIKNHPDWAVKRKSDMTNWHDYKGIGWLDAGSKDVWDYVIQIAKVSYNSGFDELNFDYIRFPSDGNMRDIYFPISNGKLKKDVVADFFKYLHENLKDTGAKISGDLFGMTTTNTDDLNIGQVLELAAPNFDYIDPMVYPSHFPNGWNGYKNPATKPYEVIKITMDKAIQRMKAINENPDKLRPWLQDFDLGATYTKEMVQAQIKAVYDSGLNSWMLWDPANTYTQSALLPESQQKSVAEVSN